MHYTIKPLVWLEHEGVYSKYWEADVFGYRLSYRVWQAPPDSGSNNWHYEINHGPENLCGSFEGGKRACQDHFESQEGIGRFLIPWGPSPLRDAVDAYFARKNGLE